MESPAAERLARRTLLAGLGLTAAAGTVGCTAAQNQDGDPVSTPSASVGLPATFSYGSDPSQFGELTLPANNSSSTGIAVVIHGGFWKAQYNLDYGRALADDLARRGWIAWNVEYRRVGNGGGTPQTFDDITASLDHLHSLDLRGVQPDTATVVLIGHSAGGHLATWAGAHRDVAAVISQAGVVDLGAADRDGLGGGAVAALLGHRYGPDDARWDPIRQVPLKAAVWCVHAADDDLVPISQSEAYVAAARSAGGRAELVDVPGGHFGVIEPSSPAWARTVTILDALPR